MNDRKELRKARLTLLGDLNRLEETHCKPCNKRNSSYVNCQSCDVYTKIRHIGKALEGEIQVGAKKNPEIEKRNEEIVQRLLNGEKPVKVAKEYHVSAAVVHQLRYKNKHLFERAGEDMIREKEVRATSHLPAQTMTVDEQTKELIPVSESEEKTLIEKVLEDHSPVKDSDRVIEFKSKIESLEQKLEYKSEKYDELKYQMQLELAEKDELITRYRTKADNRKTEIDELHRIIREKNQTIEILQDNSNTNELQKAYDDYLNEAEKCKRLKAQVSDLRNVDTMNALLMEQNLKFRKRLNDFVDGNSL